MLSKYINQQYVTNYEAERRKSSLIFSPKSLTGRKSLVDNQLVINITSAQHSDASLALKDADERSEKDTKRYKIQTKLNNEGLSDLVIDLFTCNASNLIF